MSTDKNDYKNLCMGCMHKLNEENLCGECDFIESEYNQTKQLPLRTVLKNRYLVGKQKDRNGEGLGYIGLDIESSKIVYIREFMPDNLCQRDSDKCKILVIPGCEISYRECLDEFLNYFKNLQRLKDSKAFMPIYDVFEENDTAYTVSEWMENISLEEFMVRSQKRLDWSTARPLFMPIISSLIEMSEIGINHLAISPENIIVIKSGQMKIKGFSIPTIRQINTDLEPELFTGCAAIEQYTAGAKLGEFTDVYSLAATLFYVLTGILPESAIKRQEDDRLMLPKNVVKSIPMNILTALADALQVLPRKRTQRLSDLQDKLSVSPMISLSSYDDEKEKEKENKKIKQKKTKTKNLRIGIISFIFTIIICVIVAFLILTDFGKSLGSNKTEAVVSKAEVSSTNVISPQSLANSLDDSFLLPNLVGRSLEAVQQDYKGKYEIEKSAEQFNDNVKEGYIISQSPEYAENQKLAPGSIITVVVSKGSKFRALPNIDNLTLSEACQVISKEGFKPLKSSDVARSDVNSSEIVEYKNHSAGDMLEYGSEVEIVLSKK